jgi:hypothetical protein
MWFVCLVLEGKDERWITILRQAQDKLTGFPGFTTIHRIFRIREGWGALEARIIVLV